MLDLAKGVLTTKNALAYCASNHRNKRERKVSVVFHQLEQTEKLEATEPTATTTAATTTTATTTNKGVGFVRY